MDYSKLHLGLRQCSVMIEDCRKLKQEPGVGQELLLPSWQWAADSPRIKREVVYPQTSPLRNWSKMVEDDGTTSQPTEDPLGLMPRVKWEAADGSETAAVEGSMRKGNEVEDFVRMLPSMECEEVDPSDLVTTTKAKTREDRKLEAVMKAFERMEKANQRKRAKQKRKQTPPTDKKNSPTVGKSNNAPDCRQQSTRVSTSFDVPPPIKREVTSPHELYLESTSEYVLDPLNISSPARGYVVDPLNLGPPVKVEVVEPEEVQPHNENEVRTEYEKEAQPQYENEVQTPYGIEVRPQYENELLPQCKSEAQREYENEVADFSQLLSNIEGEEIDPSALISPAKTREERKIEAIVKLFERMDQESRLSKKPRGRRKKASSEADSEPQSGDERSSGSDWETDEPSRQSPPHREPRANVQAKKKKISATVRQAKPKTVAQESRKTPDKDEVFECDLCEKRFLSSANLARHNEVTHGAQRHACATCGRHFKELRHFQAHVERHSRAKRYACALCDKAYATSSCLRQHKRIHASLRPYSCTQCAKTFVYPRDLGRHLAQHSVRRTYHSCPLCHRRFLRAADLRDHANVHGGARHFACAACARTFSTKKCVRDHIMSAHNRAALRPHRCATCAKGFASAIDLARHGSTHSGARNFPCGRCDRRYTCDKTLKTHVRTVHDGVRKEWRCERCGRVYGNRATLNMHLAVHTGVYPFPCHLCEKRYTNNAQLQHHIASHGEKLFACETCGMRFSRLRNLSAHALLHTVRERKHKCSVCGQAFVEARGLKNHAHVHSTEKPFACAACGKRFKRRDALKCHAAVHTTRTKDRPCAACGKLFASDKDVRSHARLAHSEARRHPCAVCDWTFKTASSLGTHMKTHGERERRHPCTQCGRRFLNRRELKGHATTHAEGKAFECEVCQWTFKHACTLRKHQLTHVRKVRCGDCGEKFHTKTKLIVHYNKVHAVVPN